MHPSIIVFVPQRNFAFISTQQIKVLNLLTCIVTKMQKDYFSLQLFNIKNLTNKTVIWKKDFSDTTCKHIQKCLLKKQRSINFSSILKNHTSLMPPQSILNDNFEMILSSYHPQIDVSNWVIDWLQIGTVNRQIRFFKNRVSN